MNTVLILKFLFQKPPIISTQGHPYTPKPASQLPGITALPTELWSSIIEYTILNLIKQDAPPFGELAGVLELRFVCRTFNKEVLYPLPTHTTIAQFPHTSSNSLLLRYSYPARKHALYTPLFTSAILNTCHTNSLPIVSPNLATRLLNCLVVASSLSRFHSSYLGFNHEGILEEFPWNYHAMDMLCRLCHEAGMSNCCQEYMCRPEQFYARHGKEGRPAADVHLEVALLAACGYEVKTVKREMHRLARIGTLVGHEVGTSTQRR